MHKNQHAQGKFFSSGSRSSSGGVHIHHSTHKRCVPSTRTRASGFPCISPFTKAPIVIVLPVIVCTPIVGDIIVRSTTLNGVDIITLTNPSLLSGAIVTFMVSGGTSSARLVPFPGQPGTFFVPVPADLIRRQITVMNPGCTQTVPALIPTSVGCELTILGAAFITNTDSVVITAGNGVFSQVSASEVSGFITPRGGADIKLTNIMIGRNAASVSATVPGAVSRSGTVTLNIAACPNQPFTVNYNIVTFCPTRTTTPASIVGTTLTVLSTTSSLIPGAQVMLNDGSLVTLTGTNARLTGQVHVGTTSATLIALDSCGANFLIIP